MSFRRITALVAALCLGGAGLALPAEADAPVPEAGPTAGAARNVAAANGVRPLAFELWDTWGGDLALVVGGFAFDGDRVLATDIVGGRIAVTDGRTVDFAGGPGAGDAQFNQPAGIAIRDGQVIVADAGNASVKIRDLEDLSYVSTLYHSGYEPRDVTYPLGVATSPAGDLYVTDRLGYRVQHAEPGTVWSRWFGGAGGDPALGQFIAPWGVAVAPGGSVWVSDNAAGLLTHYTSKGVPIAQVGDRELMGSAAGLAVDAAGRVYVARTEKIGVVVVGAQGEHLATIGGEDRTPAEQVLGSFAVGVHPDGRVFVGGLNGVKVFRPVLAATAAPVVAGSAKVGSTLHATSGAWPVPGAALEYQWLRGGVPVAGATSSSYTVRADDAGKRLSVRVTASRTDYTFSASASSTEVTVAKIVPTVKARLAKKKVKASARAKLVVKVTTPGLARPTGKVRILDGKKTLRTVKLKAAQRGKLTVRLPRLARGRHTITVRLLGTARIAKSPPVTVRLRVTR